ncbi:MAG: T9SS type A sorting domain-containing protein [Ginsengibacter sp.]
MKKCYLILFFIIPALFPLQKTLAQCMCTGGVIPDSVAYEQYFDSIIATNTVITFPQFDDSIGALKCMKLSDTVTTVVGYNLKNDLGYNEDYIFETYRRSQFTGPGGFFSSMTSTPKDYGPFTLMPKDSVGDNIDIGPDTTFDKSYHEQYASPNAAFYGTGTVNFNYLTTSTFTILTGSDNAIFKLRAYTRLFVRLAYYWCPYAVLATNLTGFDVSLKNNDILIKWQVQDREPLDKYEIEVSKEGKVFTNEGEGKFMMSGIVAKYESLYNLSQNFTGKLFFRIKQTKYSGGISYSAVRSVAVNGSPVATGYSLYPNPSVRGVNLQFIKATGGSYLVKLLNSTGQALFQKKYTVSTNGVINIEWPKKPAPGIYYLKVKDLKTNREETAKLQVM